MSDDTVKIELFLTDCDRAVSAVMDEARVELDIEVEWMDSPTDGDEVIGS